MSETPRDFIELFQYLNSNQVEYLIVGGYALTFYGYPVHNDDLDLFIAPNQANIQHLLQALHDFGFSDVGLTRDDFSDPDKLVRLGYPPEQLDMVTAISGLSWQEAWEKRRTGSFWGVPVQILSKELLIKNKRARGRPQDCKDAEILEQLDIDAYVERSPFSEPSIP
jgi:hypothetical protein